MKDVNPTSVLRSGKFEVEFFINSPQSTEVGAKLLDLLGGNLATYRFERIHHEIKIIILLFQINMSATKSAFQSYLQRKVQRTKSFLKEHDWLDPETHGPNGKLIEGKIKTFLGSGKDKPPEHLLTAIYLGENAGPAYEALGKQKAALDCYRLGQYTYRKNNRVYPFDQGKKEVPLMGRDDATH